MNRKKINSIIAVMSTVLTVNLGGSINVQALEMDKDTPSLQEHQNSDGNQNLTEILNPEENDEDKASAVSEEADDTAADSEAAEANDAENTTNSESDNTLDTADTNATDMETSNSSNTSSTDDSQPNESVDTDKSDFPVSEPANDKINEANTEAVNKGESKLEENAEKRLEEQDALDEEISSEEMVQSYNDAEEDEAIARICAGEAETDDYCTAIGVTLKGKYLDTVNNAEKDAAKAAGGTLDVGTIEEVLYDAQEVFDFLTTINKGTTKLNSYNSLKLTKVTDSNLKDVNIILKNRPYVRYINNDDMDLVDFYTKEQIQDCIDTGLNSMNSICTGKAGLADYENIAIITPDDDDSLKLNDDDLLQLNEGISETANGKVLTIDQIKEAVTVELNKIAIIEKINNGQESISDFNTLGITNVTDENLDYFKDALKNKDLKTVSQVRAAVEEANKVIIAIKNICSKNCTMDDYKIVGLAGEDSVTEGNFNFINEHMDVEYKGYSSLADIKESVAKSLDLIKLQLIKKVTDGIAEVSDYHQLGASQVDEDNKDFVNLKLKGTEYQTIPDVQNAVTEALNTLDSIKKINRGEGIPKDYDAINASGVTQANLRYVNSQLNGHVGYDEEEIRNKVAEAIKLCDIYDRIDKGTAKPEDYVYIGVNNVTTDNIDDVNKLVEGKHYTTAAEIDEAINSEFSKAYAMKKIKNGTAELDDYMIAGITGVDAANYKYINSQIVGRECSSKDSIQKAVDDILALYAAMKQINLGLGKAEDYALVNAASVDSNNMNFVNGYLKGKNEFDLTELQKKIENAVKVYNTIEFIKTGNAKLEDYQFLSLVDVNQSNYLEINKALKGSEVTSVQEIQDIISTIVKKKTSKQCIEDGSANLTDYENLGIKNVTLKNITFVNEEVDDTTYADIAEIQAAVDRAVTLYGEVVDINNGQGNLQKYKDVDANTKVTSQNEAYVDDYIKENKDYNLKRLINNINAAVAEYDAIETIKRGGAGVTDYRAIDIYDVSTSSLDYVNKYISKRSDEIKVSGTESQLLLKNKIKSEVEDAIIVFDAISRINKGTATLNDYIDTLDPDLKDKVNEDNIDYINFKLKGKNLTDETSIIDEINKALGDFGYISRINSGIASTGDYKAVYELIGPDEKSPVTSENINYVNRVIQGKDYTTPSSIKICVEACIKEFEAIKRINAGTGDLTDYELLKCKEVNNENIDYINKCLENQEISTPSDLNEMVAKSILCYQAIQRIKQGSGTDGDYDLIKVTGVTPDNIDFINQQLKDGNFDNEVEIQDAIDKACSLDNAIKRINAGEALPSDYNLVGTLKVNSNNIIFVNEALKGRDFKAPGPVKLEAELAVSYYDAILRIDSGNGTVEDYKLLGVSGVMDGNLAYVNEGVKDVILRNSTTGLQYFIMDEVIKEANTYVESFSALNKINLGTAKLLDYKTIGTDDVTEDNILFINTNIKGSNLKTVKDAKEAIKRLADEYTSVSRINKGIATLINYGDLDIEGVTEDILVYVNADLKEKNLLTIKDIQTMINSNMNTYIALKKINEGKGTIADYTTIGTVSVKDSNLEFVNLYITKSEKKLTASEARRNIENILAQEGAFGKINNGKGTMADYNAVGAMGVTDDNIDYINSEIAGALNPYGTNLNTVIQDILKLYDSSEIINNGKETTDINKRYIQQYYDISNRMISYDTNEGSQFRVIQESVKLYRKILEGRKLNKKEIKDIIDRVASCPDDAKYVMKKIRESLEDAKNNKGRDLNGEETKNIVDNLIATIKQTVSRVSVGEGTVEDFNFLGQYDVIDSNIDSINEDIKKYDTIGKSLSQYRLNDTNLENAVKIGRSIVAISKGNGTLSDYTNIGCTKMGNAATANAKNSLFDLTKKAIQIQTQLNDEKYLNRAEILNLIDKVEKSKDDAIALLDIIIDKLEEANGGALNLTGAEKKAIVDEVVNKQKEVAARVAGGYGTVEDFEYLGKREVTSENINVVNREIKDNPNVTKAGECRINGLDEAITRGTAIYYINTYADTAVVDQFSKLGLSVKYDSQEGSKFELIETQIGLSQKAKNGECLTGQEIIDIVNDVNNNYEDRKAILVEIQNKITEEEQAIGGKSLTAEKTDEIMKSVEKNIKEICSRVYSGNGTAADFKYLGESAVTEDNLEAINTDIKAHQTIILLSQYRVDNVKNAVNLGLAVYGVNTKSDESVKNDFTAMNIKMNFNGTDAEKFNLLKMKIDLERKLNGGRLLTRNEIFTALKDIENDMEDMKVVLPQISEEVNDKARQNGGIITSEDTNTIVDKIENERTLLCERVATGKGTVEDFKALGKTGITSTNIDVINKDIKDYKIISKVSNYRLENVDEALDKAMAVYKINTSNDKSLEKSFAALGINMPYETDDKSKFKLITTEVKIERLIKNDGYLNRSEIFKIVNDIQTNTGDQQAIIPKVDEAIEEKQNKGEITSQDVQDIIVAVKNKIAQVCKSIINGEGKATDYNYLGESRVTTDNLDVVNNDIKENGGISLLTNYTIDGLSDAVARGLAVFKINNDTDMTVTDAFTRLDKKVDYSTDKKSRFNLITSQIAIERGLNGNRYLNREEIFNIIDSIDNNIGDQEIIIPRVSEKIKEQKKQLGQSLTSDQIKSIISEVENNTKEVCKRIIDGEGTVEDYKYLDQSKVNSENILVINKDIKDKKIVKAVTAYRLDGLDEAVNNGLNIFTINNDNDQGVVEAFNGLGITVEYSADETSEFGLITSEINFERIMNEGAYIDRETILSIVDKVRKNKEDLEVSVPMINQEIKQHQKETGLKLTAQEVKTIIAEIEGNVKGLAQRIAAGEGTLQDYEAMKQKAVNADNIGVINKDIRDNKTVTVLSTYRLGGLDEAVSKGVNIFTINNENNQKVAEAFKGLGLDIEYSTEETSEFALIHSEITFERMMNNGDYIDRAAILSIVDKVRKNKEDLAVSVPMINQEIEQHQKDTGAALTAEEVKTLISTVEANIKGISQRIIAGEGTLEDYKAAGERRVNADNRDVINTDIKINKTVKALSGYKLDGLEKAVDLGLAVFNINNNNDDDSAAIDFATLGMDIAAEDSPTSKLKLIESEVKLKRMVQGGSYLTRDDIKNIVTNVTNNLSDEEIVVPKINEELIKSGSNLTGVEVQNLINTVKDKIEKVCKRISVGLGSVEDYAYLGEVRVNSENLEVVNKYIDDSKNVTILSSYRLKGLEDAVTNALSVYKINNATENSAIEDFAALGIDLEYSTEENSLFKLVQSGVKIARKEKDNAYLTKQQIIDIETKIQDHFEDSKLLIPILNSVINSEEKEDGRKLTGAETIELVNKTLNDCAQVLVRIYSGEATVADYVSVGENRITSKNIDIANSEQKEFRTITKASNYRLNDITKAVDWIVDIYNINLGAEYEKHDEKVIKDNYGNTIRKYNTNYRVKQYEDFGYNVAWDTASNSEFTLIKDQVKILRALKEGKYLTRNEIINDVINKIHTSLEDSKIIIPRIFNAMNDSQTINCRALTTAEAQEVIDTETSKMENAVSRIVAGEADAADYKYIGVLKVTDENVGVINTDVKLYRTIKALSNVRLDGLDKGINLGLAIYNINKGTVSKSADEYALIGRELQYDETNTSLFMLVQNYISIKRDLNEGALLNRDDILNAIDYVIANKEDMAILIPKIKSAMDAAKIQQGTNFTKENAAEIYNKFDEKLSSAVNRIYNGNAEVEDYVYVGETRVNNDNLKIVNKDIKENGEVIRLTKYRLGGLSEAVTKAVAVYNINNNLVSSDGNNNAKEYAILGRTVEYSGDSSLLSLIQDYISIKQKSSYADSLTRSEIVTAIDEVLGNIDKNKVLVPYIANEIYRQEELNGGNPLSVEEVEGIINQRKENLQGAARRIVAGAGRLDDYKLFGENNVTRKNIKVVDSDIAESYEVTTTSPYSLSGLSEAVQKGIAVYNLNQYMETKDTDGNIKELKVLGENVAYSDENLSVDKLLMKGIEISQRLNNEQPISRNKILDMLYEIEENLDEAKAKIPQIIVDIYEQDHIQGITILGDDVQAIIDKYVEKAEQK